MLTYKTLIAANLTALSEAVARWEKLPDKFRKVGSSFTTEVSGPLRDSTWSGKAADGAKAAFTRVEKEIERAAGEAADVHGFIKAAHSKLRSCQKQLLEYKENLDRSTYLQIDDTGKVSRRESVLGEGPTGGKGALRDITFGDSVDHYNREISQILEDARGADRDLKWALSLDPNGKKQGFTDTGVNSLQDIGRARKEAAEDARAFVKLASVDDRVLTTSELNRANAYLREHAGDPSFREKTLTSLGARGTLEFWQRNVDEPQTGGARTKALQGLQKSMSLTLANASHSDSPAMNDWKRDVIKLGNERFPDTNFSGQALAPGRTGKGPYGFQIMSSLMRHGEYDKDFLVDYGQGYKEDGKQVPGLIDFDKKASENGSLKDFWQPDGYTAMLNVGSGSDKGMDPMAGYMEALGHNSEAAQELFFKEGYRGQSGATPDSDLKYLLRDREWPDGNPRSADCRGYGYDELGHALEAATLGRSYDEPELGLKRSEASANIMSQVVAISTDGEPLVDEKLRPGGQHLSDSLAKMGAGYIDNLDWAVANSSDRQEHIDRYDRVFGEIGASDLKVEHQQAVGFLRDVGGTVDGHKILSAAQTDFTVNQVKGDPGSGEYLKELFRGGAEVQGIMDSARADSILGDADDTKEAKAQKLSEAAEWQKAGWGQGANVVSTVVEGAATGARAMAYAVPVVDTAAQAMATEQGILIDQVMQREQDKYDAGIDAQSDDLKSGVEGAGKKRVAIPLAAYLEANPARRDGEWQLAMENEIENGYDRGFK